MDDWMATRPAMPQHDDAARIKFVTAPLIACVTFAGGIVLGWWVAADNDACVQATRESTHVIRGQDLLIGRFLDFLEAPPGSHEETPAAEDVFEINDDLDLDMADWQRERDACLLLPGDE